MRCFGRSRDDWSLPSLPRGLPVYSSTSSVVDFAPISLLRLPTERPLTNFSCQTLWAPLSPHLTWPLCCIWRGCDCFLLFQMMSYFCFDDSMLPWGFSLNHWPFLSVFSTGFFSTASLKIFNEVPQPGFWALSLPSLFLVGISQSFDFTCHVCTNDTHWDFSFALQTHTKFPFDLFAYVVNRTLGFLWNPFLLQSSLHEQAC